MNDRRKAAIWKHWAGIVLEGCPIHINNTFIYRDGNHIRRNFTKNNQEILVDRFGLKNAINWSHYKYR